MIKFTIIASLLSITLFSNSSYSLELTVKVAKIKTLEQKITMDLFLLPETTAQSWDTLTLIEKRIIELHTKNQVIAFSNLQAGTYAIRVFQDTNDNTMLDKSTNDIPLEPVGFSQNPSLFGGEPTPEDSAIILAGNQHININLKHRKSKRKRKSE